MYISYGRTHKGLVRKENQDSIYLNDQLGLYIVADGMGGHLGGKQASTLIVDMFPDLMEKKLANSDPATFDPFFAIKESVAQINSEMHRLSIEKSELRGMGSTLVAHFSWKDKVYIINVGDSRSYCTHNHLLYQLSVDHSFFKEKIDMAVLLDERRPNHEFKNVLSKAMGVEQHIDVDIFEFEIPCPSLLLLCSDGMHGNMGDGEIHQIIESELGHSYDLNEQILENISEKLLTLSLDRGGDDNISIVLSAYCP